MPVFTAGMSNPHDYLPYWSVCFLALVHKRIMTSVGQIIRMLLCTKSDAAVGSNDQCEQLDKANSDHQHREGYGIVVEPIPPLCVHDTPPLSRLLVGLAGRMVQLWLERSPMLRAAVAHEGVESTKRQPIIIRRLHFGSRGATRGRTRAKPSFLDETQGGFRRPPAMIWMKQSYFAARTRLSTSRRPMHRVRKFSHAIGL
jgi:hypothetical protein